MSDRQRVLETLRELEVADEELAAGLAELDELAGKTISVRTRALELEDFLARYPAERQRVAAEVERASWEVEAASAALAEARAAVENATEERAADARRFEVRARDRLSVAERRLADAKYEAATFDSDVLQTEHDARELESTAGALALSLRGRPRLAAAAGDDPGRGLEAAVSWAEAARAALFVARGQLVAEREGVIRQANELGAVTLGEPLSASSASLVARRLEQELR